MSPMRINEVPPEQLLYFKPGDLVLVRYSSFPYWPAVVSPTHQKRYKGKHSTKLCTRGGDLVLCFWCNFANDDSGGWVRADRMIMFHPAILDKIRVPKDNEWCIDQRKAIKSAIKSFHEKHDGEGKQIPELTSDLENGPHNGRWDVMDNDDIITDCETYPNFTEGEDPIGQKDKGKDEEGRASPRHSAGPSKGRKNILSKYPAQKESRKAAKRSSTSKEEPRTKKRPKTTFTPEKDMLSNVDSDAEDSRRKIHRKNIQKERADPFSRKRRRHVYTEPSKPSKKVRKMEAELASYKERIANLKKTVKRTDRKLSELTGGGAGLACVIPPLPPQLQELPPESQKPRSNTVNSEEFSKMMDTLSSEYESFETAATSADDARIELESTMETIKKLYNAASSKVSTAEEKANHMANDVVRNLCKILKADVQVQDLQERRAGKAIRAMRKDCKTLPVIRNYCSVICVLWKTQVLDYMKEAGKEKTACGSESPAANA